VGKGLRSMGDSSEQDFDGKPRGATVDIGAVQH
jgi:hypothetical protein